MKEFRFLNLFLFTVSIIISVLVGIILRELGLSSREITNIDVFCFSIFTTVMVYFGLLLVRDYQVDYVHKATMLFVSVSILLSIGIATVTLVGFSFLVLGMSVLIAFLIGILTLVLMKVLKIA